MGWGVRGKGVKRHLVGGAVIVVICLILWMVWRTLLIWVPILLLCGGALVLLSRQRPERRGRFKITRWRD